MSVLAKQFCFYIQVSFSIFFADW